jgi:HK97 family phage major capsid protein
MDKKQLLEQRKAAYDKVHEIREAMKAEGRDEIKPEEREAWEKANSDFDKFDEELKRCDRMDELEQRMQARHDTPKPGREDRDTRDDSPDMDMKQARDLALKGWMRFQLTGEMSDEQRDAMSIVGLSPHKRELDINLRNTAPRTLAECRAQSVGTDSAGGYTVPEGFSGALEEALLYYGGIRNAVDVWRTSSGQQIPWPTTNDTSNSGALLAENTQDSEKDVTFSEVVFNAYKYTSKLVRVSRELLEDSAFDMGNFLGRALGERLGRAQNAACTTGTGTAQPKGLVTAATLGKTAASASTITFDELMDLQHSVDIAYRNMPNAGWMFADSTLKVIRQLKDSDNNYIWQNGNIQTGAPSQLLGKSYTVNNDMAAIAASAKTVLFGDFGKYKLREVNNIRFYRLVERYADYDQDGFVAFMRFDGDLLDAGTNPVKYLAQASGS